MSALKILIVEDEAVVGMDLQDRLHAMNYEVLDVVPTGEEALRCVEQGPPDLILMDIQLAGEMDGIETADRVRAEHDIPVIFLTANSDEATLKRARVTGPHGYLLKPLDERALYSTIEMAAYRHQLDEHVARSEVKLFTTLKSIADAVITTDAQGQIEFMNPVAEALTGWSADEAKGVPHLHVIQLQDEHSGQVLCNAVEETMQLGHAVRYTDRALLVSRDGAQHPVDESVAPISDASGELLGTVIVFRDTSGRRRIEAAIREGEEKFRCLCESTDDAIIMADVAGQIILWSHGAQLMFGYSDTEALGMVYGRLFAPGSTSWSQPASISKNVPGDPFGSTVEKVGIRKDGTEFPVEISFSISGAGDHSRTVVVCRDISMRKHLEKQLEAHQLHLESLVKSRTHELSAVNDQLRAEMQKRAAAEKRRLEIKARLDHAERLESLALLAGGVAHDLNNTLVPLVGYPEVLLAQLPEDSPYRKMVDRMGRAAKEAAEVIQDLLAMGRRGRYQMVAFDFNEMIRSYLDSAGFAKLSAAQPQVIAELDLASDVCPVMGSDAHLSKCVMNLVVNAFDAMSQGGQLCISTRRQIVESLLPGLDAVRPGRYVVLSVKDTGIGIDPGEAARIFEPYYSKKKMGSSGSGLGLSVVHGIVHDHGAAIQLRTEIGRGTEFLVYFPESEIQPAPDHRSIAIDGQGETVLVIDDDPTQLEAAEVILDSLGYRVLKAANGNEAELIVRERTVDLILLDMILGDEVDGLPVFLNIRKLKPDQRVLIVSGFGVSDDVKRMQELGAGTFVAKPYSRSTLGRAIREELEPSR